LTLTPGDQFVASAWVRAAPDGGTAPGAGALSNLNFDDTNDAPLQGGTPSGPYALGPDWLEASTSTTLAKPDAGVVSFVVSTTVSFGCFLITDARLARKP
jgi:hypothetical protein